MLIDAMVKRAHAGGEVRLPLDAAGSAMMAFGATLRRLREAGCNVQFYQRLTWYRFHRLNNRTHRELLIVDGRVAFTGGAGVAGQGLKTQSGPPAGRDTMKRGERPVVTALPGAFLQDWARGFGADFPSAP